MTVQLNDSLLIGEGSTRRCYQHPDNTHWCVKIDNEEEGVKPTYRESVYYGKLAKRMPQFEYNVIPEFHGFIETNLGRGGVFDLCRNEDDGAVAATLAEFTDREMDAAERKQLEDAVQVFCKDLLKYWIVSTDLKSHNICVVRQLDKQLRLVCIDGLGSKEHLPFCDIWPWWARRKMQRHFKRYHLNNMDDLIKFGAGLKPKLKKPRR